MTLSWTTEVDGDLFLNINKIFILQELGEKL